MSRARFALETTLAAMVGLAAFHSATALGQAYPNKPIRIITAEAGGGGDFVSRQIATRLAPAMGQPMVVDNRPTAVGPDAVAASAPDGYTLFVAGNSFWIVTLLRKTRYDAIRDFDPIVAVAAAPHILIVHPSLPATSVKELIALAKAKPGTLNYGEGATGAVSHLGAELFKSMADVNIVHIPYKGGAAALSDLLAGRVQVMLASGPALLSHMKAGRLRGLGVGSAQPTALAPGVPTVSASGLPGYEAETLIGTFAPAKTPQPIIAQLGREISAMLKQPDARETFAAQTYDIVPNSTPEQFAAYLKADLEKWGRVIKQAGIKLD